MSRKCDVTVRRDYDGYIFNTNNVTPLPEHLSPCRIIQCTSLVKPDRARLQGPPNDTAQVPETYDARTNINIKPSDILRDRNNSHQKRDTYKTIILSPPHRHA